MQQVIIFQIPPRPLLFPRKSTLKNKMIDFVHVVRSHPHLVRSHPHSARSHSQSARYLRPSYIKKTVVPPPPPCQQIQCQMVTRLGNEIRTSPSLVDSQTIPLPLLVEAFFSFSVFHSPVPLLRFLHRLTKV
jgi:hypothetical protein